MPVAGKDYPGTWQAFETWFPDDDACRAYLERLRWPEGFVCPVCSSTTAWRTKAGLWMCTQCQRKTSVTAGTIFHRSRMPLKTWFAACWFVCSQKNGVSALGLQRVLGFGSYETAWAWMHKLRRAMVRPDRDLLSGVVEVDETFVGGREHAGRRASRSTKAAVAIAVEMPDAGGLGRVRLRNLEPLSAVTVRGFITDVVAPGSLVRTDGWSAYRAITNSGYTHEPISVVHLTEPAHSVARRAPSRVAAQTMARRDPPQRRRSLSPRVLPRRVHLPVQPPQLPQARPAVLPAPPTSREHRPPPPKRPHPRRSR